MIILLDKLNEYLTRNDEIKIFFKTPKPQKINTYFISILTKFLIDPNQFEVRHKHFVNRIFN